MPSGDVSRSCALIIFVAILWTNLAVVDPAVSAADSLTPISRITGSLTNSVTVEAIVSSIREPSSERAPYVVSLTQGNATLPLVYWSNMQPELAQKIKVGNLIRAKVKVKLYQNRLELQISGPDAIKLIRAASPAPVSTNTSTQVAAPAPPPAAPAPPPPPVAPTPPAPPPPPSVRTVIGKIKDDWVGRNVTISGTVSDIDNGGKSRRLSLQDATGEIQIVLNESQITGLGDQQLMRGRVLTIIGPVSLVDGKLTIIPDASGAVTIVPPGRQ
jgi:DNA/RNA endonuclease YhcR with UshA esterase domain